MIQCSKLLSKQIFLIELIKVNNQRTGKSQTNEDKFFTENTFEEAFNDEEDKIVKENYRKSASQKDSKTN